MERFIFYGQANERQQLDVGIRLKKFIIKSVCIPNTFYNVISGFNDQLAIWDSVLASVQIITLDEGWYDTATLLCAEIQNKLNALGGNTYVVSYDSVSYFITISTSTGTFYIDGDYNERVRNLIFMLGYEQKLYSASASISSSFALQLCPFEAFYITISEFGGAQKTAGNFQAGDIHAVIPISGSPDSVTRFEAENRFKSLIEISERSVNSFTPHIQILDFDNKLKEIDFHGVPIRIYLEYTSN